MLHEHPGRHGKEEMMRYLNWAKLHRRVRYELTGSGVPPARPADLGTKPLPVSLEVKGGMAIRTSLMP